MDTLDKTMNKFTVMMNFAKNEMRVVYLGADAIEGFSDLRYLPEHVANPPSFATANKGWEFIRENYPQFQP